MNKNHILPGDRRLFDGFGLMDGIGMALHKKNKVAVAEHIFHRSN